MSVPQARSTGAAPALTPRFTFASISAMTSTPRPPVAAITSATIASPPRPCRSTVSHHGAMAAAPASLPAVPITTQPCWRASCRHAVPTAPVAPCTRTVAPAASRALWCSARYAVYHGAPMAAPAANETAGGRMRRDAASATATSAYAPVSVFRVYTRSPTANDDAASGPTASTTPAASWPGVYGSAGSAAYTPDRMYVSTGLTPTAWTRTRTSCRGMGGGRGDTVVAGKRGGGRERRAHRGRELTDALGVGSGSFSSCSTSAEEEGCKGYWGCVS